MGPDPQRASDVYDTSVILRSESGHSFDQWDGDFITDPTGGRPKNPVQLGLLLQGHVDRWYGTDPPRRLRGVFDRHRKTWTYRVDE